MWKQRLKQAIAIVLVGDAAIGLLRPRRHSRLWKNGPKPYRDAMQFFVERPNFLRVISVAEAALGYWIAIRAEEEN